MNKLIWAEGKRTAQSITLWVVFAIMVSISFIYSGAAFSRFPEQLSSAYGIQYASSRPISRGEYVFLRTMGDASFTAWMSVIAGALLIGMDFENRTINNLIFAGNRRITIVIVKLFYFFISSILLSAVYPIISCLRFSTKWFSELNQDDILYVLRCASYRAIIDMAMMSFALISVFIFKDIIKTLVCSLIIIVFLSLLMNAANGTENEIMKTVIEYFPARSIQRVMMREADTETVQKALLYSGIMVMVTCVSCFLLFRKADLR